MNCAPGMCAASYSLLSPTCSSTRELSLRCFDNHSVDTIIELLILPCACDVDCIASAAAETMNAKNSFFMTPPDPVATAPGSDTKQVIAYNIAVSSRDRPSAKRLTLNCEASIRSEWPCRIRSALTRPDAGECITPWPLKPF